MALLLLIAAQPATAQQPRITPSPETTEDEYNANWNSHIDNQAYFEQRRMLRDRAITAPPVIIIERQTEQGYLPSQFCQSSITGKYRYSDDSGVARSQRPKNHHDL